MQLFIMRTDIGSARKVNAISSTLNQNPNIQKWSVDLYDIDNVLRVEARNPMQERDLINLVERHGFCCEALPD